MQKKFIRQKTYYSDIGWKTDQEGYYEPRKEIPQAGGGKIVLVQGVYTSYVGSRIQRQDIYTKERITYDAQGNITKRETFGAYDVPRGGEVVRRKEIIDYKKGTREKFKQNIPKKTPSELKAEREEKDIKGTTRSPYTGNLVSGEPDPPGSKKLYTITTSEGRKYVTPVRGWRPKESGVQPTEEIPGEVARGPRRNKLEGAQISTYGLRPTPEGLKLDPLSIGIVTDQETEEGLKYAGVFEKTSSSWLPGRVGTKVEQIIVPVKEEKTTAKITSFMATTPIRQQTPINYEFTREKYGRLRKTERFEEGNLRVGVPDYRIFKIKADENKQIKDYDVVSGENFQLFYDTKTGFRLSDKPGQSIRSGTFTGTRSGTAIDISKASYDLNLGNVWTKAETLTYEPKARRAIKFVNIPSLSPAGSVPIPYLGKSRYSAEEWRETDVNLVMESVGLAEGVIGYPYRASKSFATVERGDIPGSDVKINYGQLSRASGELAIFWALGKAGGGYRFAKNELGAKFAEYVPPGKVFETNYKGEIQAFSTTTSVRASLQSFERGRTIKYSKAGEPRLETVHVSQAKVKAGEVGPGESADTGLYVSPTERGSPYFTGLTPKEAYYGFKFSLLGSDPQVSMVYTTGIKRIPKKSLSKGFDVSNEYLRGQAETGSAFITRRSELAFDKRLFTAEEIRLQRQKKAKGQTSLSTGEAEAIVPEGTGLEFQKPSRFINRVFGFEKYTEYEGTVIPIRDYRTVPGRTGVTGETLKPKTEAVQYLYSGKSRLEITGAGVSSLGVFRGSLKPSSQTAVSSKAYSKSGLRSSISGLSSAISSGTSLSRSSVSRSSVSTSSSILSLSSSGSSSRSSISSALSSIGSSSTSRGSGSYSSSSSSESIIPSTGTPGTGTFSFSLFDEPKKGKGKRKGRKYRYQRSFFLEAGESVFGTPFKAPKLKLKRFTGFEVRG